MPCLTPARRRCGLDLAAERVVGDVVKSTHREAGNSSASIENTTESRRAPPSSFGGRRAAQPALLDEAELSRDVQASFVPWINLDVDAVELDLLEADTREHRGQLGREALPDRVGPDPVADLERPLPTRGCNPPPPSARDSSGSKTPYTKFVPRSNSPRKDRATSIFSSTVCGSKRAHGIQGRRCSRLESTASFISGASSGSQQRITRRSVSMR